MNDNSSRGTRDFVRRNTVRAGDCSELAIMQTAAASPRAGVKALKVAATIGQPFRIRHTDKVISSGPSWGAVTIWVIRNKQRAQLYPSFRKAFSVGAMAGIIGVPRNMHELEMAKALLQFHPRGDVPRGSFLIATIRQEIVGCAVIDLLTYTSPPCRAVFLRKVGTCASEIETTRFAWARRFIVSKKWQRRGVGTALAKSVIPFVRRFWLPKCIAVEVYTSKDEGFLRDAGYDLVGVTGHRQLYYAKTVMRG